MDGSVAALALLKNNMQANPLHDYQFAANSLFIATNLLSIKSIVSHTKNACASFISTRTAFLNIFYAKFKLD